MTTKSTREVADILRIADSRMEQWISRKQFIPSIFPPRGTPREWREHDAFRLFVFLRLVDMIGMDAATAGRLTTAFTMFKDEGAFFVAYHGHPNSEFPGWWSEVVRKSQLADYLTSGCVYPKLLAPGRDAETIKRNSEKRRGPAYAAIILDLDALEEEFEALWKKAA